jgi:hypothetical protein
MSRMLRRISQLFVNSDSTMTTLRPKMANFVANNCGMRAAPCCKVPARTSEMEIVMTQIAESVYTAGRDELFFQHWDQLDKRLATAREYVEELEADPVSDELAIVTARHELWLCKRELARILADED